jgi:hypothetical protein
MNTDEFEATYTQILETLLRAFANSAEVRPEKFYSLANAIENLHHSSPALYEAIKSLEDRQLKDAG